MKDLTVRQLQNYLELKYKDKISTDSLFMKLVEEMGEVAEMLNQLEGRKEKTASNSLANELVDVIHYTVAVAAINDIDLNKAIIEKDKIGSIKYNQTPNLEEYLGEFK